MFAAGPDRPGATHPGSARGQVQRFGGTGRTVNVAQRLSTLPVKACGGGGAWLGRGLEHPDGAPGSGAGRKHLAVPRPHHG